ncbi:MAG: hypothetical protein IIZ25_05185 [Thermoguttaceae bacterium]|nr:hypothetical protein [Thermoguttaceae bacterium]
MMPRKPDRDISKAKIPARYVSVLFTVCLFVLMAGTLNRFAKTYYSFLGVGGRSDFLARTPDRVTQLAHKETSFWKNAAKGRTIDLIRYCKHIYSNDFFCKYFFVDLHGGIGKLCGKKTLYNSPHSGRLRTNDNLLFERDDPLSPLSCVQRPMTSSQLERLRDFKRYLDARGTKLIYLLPPCREDLGDDTSLDVLYQYKQSPLYKEKERIIEFLKENNISSFDAFEEFAKNTPSINDWFYRTDHHWRIDCVFEMMPALADHIRGITHLDLPYGKDIFSAERFHEIRHPRFFIGSLGRQAGRFFVPPDDFIFYLPSFDTDYSIDMKLLDGDTVSFRGKFEETLFDEDIVETSKLFGTFKYRYYAYCGLDYPQQHFVNHNVDTGRILIIKDSMGIPVGAFLSFMFHETMMVDLRYQTSDFSLDRLIDRYQPDIVLIVYRIGDYQDAKFRFL